MNFNARSASAAVKLTPVGRLPRLVVVTTKDVFDPAAVTRGETEMLSSSNGATWISAVRVPIGPFSSLTSMGSWYKPAGVSRGNVISS